MVAVIGKELRLTRRIFFFQIRRDELQNLNCEMDIHVNLKKPHLKHKREYHSMSFINLSDSMSMKMTVFSTPVMPCHFWHTMVKSLWLDTIASAPQHSRHPLQGAVQIWHQSDWWFQRYRPFCAPPVLLVWHPLFFWTMLVPTSSASMPATSVLCQIPVNVPVPTYDWNMTDQMQEFCLFKCQLDTWFWFCKIKAEEHLDYLLCILGKEGYAAMDHWVPPHGGHKPDLEKFLNYIESTLYDEISPWVHVYELEDVKKRSDKSVDELIDRICQLACSVQIGNGSNATIEFEVQCRLIWAIPDADIELQKELQGQLWQKSIWSTGDQLHIIRLLSWEELQCVPVKPSMPSAKAINLRRTSHRSVPQLHLFILLWPWQLPCMDHDMQRLFQNRSLAGEVLQLWCCRPKIFQVWWSWEGLL